MLYHCFGISSSDRSIFLVTIVFHLFVVDTLTCWLSTHSGTYLYVTVQKCACEKWTCGAASKNTLKATLKD
jgi:hypothetical protein